MPALHHPDIPALKGTVERLAPAARPTGLPENLCPWLMAASQATNKIASRLSSLGLQLALTELGVTGSGFGFDLSGLDWTDILLDWLRQNSTAAKERAALPVSGT